jgi:hypothetical protein
MPLLRRAADWQYGCDAKFRRRTSLTLLPTFQGRVMIETQFRVEATDEAEDQIPDWWPYAPEFPHWHVWRGVAGLLYARRPRSTPPIVVRASDAAGLRERIRQAAAAR